MAKKRIDKKELDSSLAMYSEYFTDINQTYEDLLTKTKKILSTTEKQVDELSNMPQGTRGAQHYLSEHLENASSLISQCQSINDSRFKIKKTLLEYAIKDITGANEGESVDYSAEIAKLVKDQKQQLEKQEEKIEKMLNEQNLDDEIDRILSTTKTKEGN